MSRKSGTWSLNRREFMQTATAAAAGAALTGCMTDPITGKRRFSLITEEMEIALDKEHAPHQVSQDFGAVQDDRINAYLDSVTQNMAMHSHRPHMPYNVRAVNAVYVNGYTFPAGTMGVTRGLLLEMQNEAELAALMGHELGHVNARHAASRMTKGMLVQAALFGIVIAGGEKHEDMAMLAAGLGMVGAGLLLAHYSRGDERQADDLGLEYMVAGDYPPSGMPDLMGILAGLSEREPSKIELMLSTHPLSRHRMDNTRRTAERRYAAAMDRPAHRERYMDNITSIRAIEGAILSMQKGNRSMGRNNMTEAEQHYSAALKEAPNDYAGLLLMAHCQLAQDRRDRARSYIERAKEVYPDEPAAIRASGALNLESNRFAAAHADFARHQSLLPGDPAIDFMNGRALEGMGRKPEAAEAFQRFLRAGAFDEPAEYARTRLVEWGYIE